MNFKASISEEHRSERQDGRLNESVKLKVESGKLNVHKSDKSDRSDKSDKCISKSSQINILPKQHNVKDLSDLSGLSYLSDFKKKVAFTLAEVLITLGVIGVIAGMTMPTLIADHKKKVVVTRMQKFYSSMNQALKLSEAQNGEYQYWDEISPAKYNSDMIYSWYQRYLADYLKSKDVKKTADGILVANTDGSAFGLYNSNSSRMAIHVVFCPEYKGCKNFLKANNNKITGPLDGKNTFLFHIGGENMRAYGINENITREQAKDSGGNHACSQSYKAYCSALIQMDGWKISDDYPVKF